MPRQPQALGSETRHLHSPHDPPGWPGLSPGPSSLPSIMLRRRQEVGPRVGHRGTWLETPCSLLRGVWRVGLWGRPGLARGLRLPYLKHSFAFGLGEQWGGGGRPVLQRPRPGGWACSRRVCVHVHECADPEEGAAGAPTPPDLTCLPTAPHPQPARKTASEHNAAGGQKMSSASDIACRSDPWFGKLVC